MEEYRYDAAGRRDYEVNTRRNISRVSPGDFVYDYDDRVAQLGGITYTHDEDGFLRTRTDADGVITRYDYSQLGELRSVALREGQTDQQVITYTHDPLSRRIAKKINGVTTEKYLWTGQTRLLAVYDGNDNLLMRFEYADARLPVAMTKAGVTYYPAYDQVGSLRAVSDASGTVVKRLDYDTFGNILGDTNPAFAVPFGFAGGLHDRDTGLVRFGYRDYDPETGRWTAKDPIGFAGGDVDLYGYCLGDPVNWGDPAGLSPALYGAVFDFVDAFLSPNPPSPSYGGAAGYFARSALDNMGVSDAVIEGVEETAPYLKNAASYMWESYWKDNINRNWRETPWDPYYEGKNEPKTYYWEAPEKYPGFIDLFPNYFEQIRCK